MSADNYSDCPQCIKRAKETHAVARKSLEDSYGKIPADEYLKQNAKLARAINYEKETMREDYPIGVYENTFEVSYSARCTVCGFTFKYNYKEEVILK